MENVSQHNRITVRAPTGGRFSLNLGEVWAYRDLLALLVWRNTVIKYKQSVIGIGWAMLKPVVSMVILTLVFGRLARLPSDGIPYPVFAYVALLPWQYFSGSLSGATGSLLTGSSLLTKVYFPRLILPLSELFTGLVDFAVSSVVLAGLLVWYRAHVVVTPAGLACLPVFIVFAMLTAFAFGLWLTALSVKYRDVQHLMPFVVQIWMYLTPVVYPSSLVPERFRVLFALNPMTGVVDGFRWALLGARVPDWGCLAVSAAVTGVVLVGGLYFFRRTERVLVDIL